MRVFDQNSNIFNLLSEAVSEGILVVNKDQVIVATNSRTDEMFGYKTGELKGRPLEVLIPPSYRESHQKQVTRYHQNRDNRRMAQGRELFGLRKNREQFPLEIGLNPFSLYGNSYVMALIIDITDVKEKEREIQELNADLEKKIKRRTVELRDTVAELKKEIKLRVSAEKKIKSALQKERELNELKTKFLSLVSHEFKTPLSGIMTSATLVGKYNKEEEQAKRDKHLKTIIGEVKRLNTILTDFLSIERLREGKEVYRFTPFSLSNSINEVVYNSNMLLKSGQRINYPQNIEDVVICQDEKIVSLVLTNLLHNAIKYSSEDTVIDLRVALHDDHIVFEVIDQGIGIPEKDQKHIFERYFRAENAILNSGTGIGLHIIKGHLKNLNGDISFTSTEHQGSTFTVTLPLVHSEGT